MKGYILRWNPKISSWTYEMHIAMMNAFSNGESIEMNWSIHDFENLEEGDFFILQQVGTDSDGIAMVGTFCSEPYTEASWKKKDGTNLFYADMAVDLIINRKTMVPKTGKANSYILNADELSAMFPKIDWHKGQSGVLIPEADFEHLVLEVCHSMFMSKISTEYEAYPDTRLLWQKACDYINSFCPNMRERIITESADRIVYKNFKEGEPIDRCLMDITFEHEKMRQEIPGPEFFPKFLVPRA